MAVFPTPTLIDNPFTMEMEFKTLFSPFEDVGQESRKQKWLYPRRNITIKASMLTVAQGQTLWEFYQARGGSYEAFNFFDDQVLSYTQEYVGSGDGSTVIFNLPCGSASGTSKVYVDGVEQTGGGTDYTWYKAGGTDGADKITFTAAPSEGKRITFSFIGYLKVHCRFQDDNLSWDTLASRIVSTGIKLKGLLNE
jgi:hypothetical protein